MNFEQAIRTFYELKVEDETYSLEEEIERDERTPTFGQLRNMMFHASTKQQKDAIIKLLWVRAEIDARARSIADSYLDAEWNRIVPIGEDGEPNIKRVKKHDIERLREIAGQLREMGINSEIPWHEREGDNNIFELIDDQRKERERLAAGGAPKEVAA